MMAKKVRWRLMEGKSWRQKLETPHPSHGKIVPIAPRYQKTMGQGTMIIPRPIDVDAVMRTVRKGKLITQTQIRERLAVDGGVDAACPMTTGIFIKIAAEAAEEDRRAGKKRITPYWRTIRDDGKLNEGFPGGSAAQAKLLKAEGFIIEAGKGKQLPRVVEHGRFLVR